MAPSRKNMRKTKRFSGRVSKNRGRSSTPRTPKVNPAVINSQPTSQRTLVWMGTVSSASAVSVSRACILSQLVLISSGSVTSTTFPCLMTSARIKSVTVWTPAIPNNVNTPNTGISFQWLSDLGAEVKKTRVTLGSIASSFTTSPPTLSRAGMWSRAASLAATLEEVLFTLDIEEGVSGETTQTIYVSMDLEYKIADASPGRLNVTFSGSETLSYGMYQMWLDLLTPSNVMGTLTLAPVGLQTPVPAAAITALTRTS